MGSDVGPGVRDLCRLQIRHVVGNCHEWRGDDRRPLPAFPAAVAGNGRETLPLPACVRRSAARVAWLWAIAKTALGAWLLWGVAREWGQGLAAGGIGMAGFVFLLHFGGFDLLSLAMRRAGIDARPLMTFPAAAQSLGDFWGRRWNAGFRDLAFGLIFRPMCRRLGVAGATMAAFLASGLVHDLVISLPASGGYGLPTGYFVLQGLGVLAERAMPVTGRIAGRVFALAMVVAPIGLLFPPVFIERVIVPFMRAIGAL